MKRWIVTMGGAGYLSAPGTFGSLVTCLLLWPLLVWAGANLPLDCTIAIVGVVLFSAFNLATARWAISHFGKKDPGSFVLDEAAGICLTILLLPVRVGWMGTGLNLLAAFIAFRIFDITKPPPARQLEKLPEGWGILLDDLAAAIYANIVCQIVLRLVFIH